MEGDESEMERRGWGRGEGEKWRVQCCIVGKLIILVDGRWKKIQGVQK